jgi:hypothetical protein
MCTRGVGETKEEKEGRDEKVCANCRISRYRRRTVLSYWDGREAPRVPRLCAILFGHRWPATGGATMLHRTSRRQRTSRARVLDPEREVRV